MGCVDSLKSSQAVFLSQVHPQIEDVSAALLLSSFGASFASSKGPWVPVILIRGTDLSKIPVLFLEEL